MTCSAMQMLALISGILKSTFSFIFLIHFFSFFHEDSLWRKAHPPQDWRLGTTTTFTKDGSPQLFQFRPKAC